MKRSCPKVQKGVAMVPGQSTEDLGQQNPTMRAGEEEESSRGSRRHHLRKLPAAAGKAAGAECQLFASSSMPVELRLGAGENSPAKPRDSPGTLSQLLKVPEGENVSKEGGCWLQFRMKLT